MNINFMACAGLHPLTGYGKMEIAIWRELHKLGVEINPLGFVRESGIAALPEQARPKNEPGKLADITLITGKPEMGLDFPARYTRRWLFTMSESDKVSDAWVRDINRYIERVIVCCPDLVKVYFNSGVRVPIHYIPLGVDYVEWPEQLTYRVRDKFCFLTYSYGDLRKGAELAILAFKSLFGEDDRFQLWVKERNIADTWVSNCADEQILVIKGETTEYAWQQLVWNANAFLFPSRGEGFGLPPREATLAGTPTLATQWLGMWDVEQWGLPINVLDLRQSGFDFEGPNARNSRWAEPSMDHMKSQMDWVVRNQQEARQIARDGRKYLLENFTWSKTGRDLYTLLEAA